MRRICLVGAGYISDAHADAVCSLPNARLQAIVDPNADAARQLARLRNIPDVFTSIDEALAGDKFDVAHVLVPPDIHGRAALPILRAGKAVLLEKPIAASSAECDTLLAATSEKAILGVNQNFVYHPAFMRLRDMIQRGTLGKPNFISCIYNVPLRQLAAGQLGHWMFRAPVNILLEQAVHPLSQVAALAGSITEVKALAGPSREIAPDVPFFSAVNLSLQCQQLPAELRFAVGQSFSFWQITVICDDGVATADILANRTFTFSRTRWSEGIDGFLSGHRTASEIVRSTWRNAVDYGLTTLRLKGRTSPFQQSIRTSVAAFYAALDAGQTPECDGRFGAALVSACEKIRDQLPCAPKTAFISSTEPGRTSQDGPRSITIFGGTGFIGTHVVEHLLERGERVTVVARNIQNLPALFHHPGVTLCRGDIFSQDDVVRAIGSAKRVINLAHGGGGQSWEEIRDRMVGGAENVAKACLALGADRLVHVGSIASLYLGSQSDLVTGATPPDPRSDERADYARAKAVSDRLLLELHARQGLRVTILRPGLVVGAGSSPFHSGLGFYNNEQHCIGWNSGNNPLPFVLVEDVANAIAQATFAENMEGRCFNLVGDVCPTAREYIFQLGRALGRPLQFHGKLPLGLWSEELLKWAIKRAAGRRSAPPHFRDLLSRGLTARFDCEDAKQALNWKPVADPEEFWRRAVYVHVS